LRKSLLMGTSALDVSRLSRDEQFDLLDRLWELLGRDPQALPLREVQKADLDRRLDELDAERAPALKAAT
jgi:putative addiction module component (TIGR02574 family)